MTSYKHNFIFVHIPKTGGNSIQNILIDYSECQLTINRIVVPQGKKKNIYERFGVSQGDFYLDKHATLNTYSNRLSNDFFKSSTKFSVVRNPWDRMISFYFWKGNKSFNKKRFIETTLRTQQPCLEYLYVKKRDNIQTDFLLRFENLQQDFHNICDKIGIPREELPHVNKSKHKHYSEYYDSETREIVAKKHARDIEYFGYKFGQ